MKSVTMSTSEVRPKGTPVREDRVMQTLDLEGNQDAPKEISKTSHGVKLIQEPETTHLGLTYSVSGSEITPPLSRKTVCAF